LIFTEECFYFGFWIGVRDSDESESIESSVIVLGFLLLGLPIPTLVCSLLIGASLIGFK